MKYKLNISSLVMLDVEDAIYFYEAKRLGLGDELKPSLFSGIDSIILNPFHLFSKVINILPLHE